MFNVQRPPISKTADYLPDFSRVVARLGARNKSDTVSVVSLAFVPYLRLRLRLVNDGHWHCGTLRSTFAL